MVVMALQGKPFQADPPSDYRVRYRLSGIPTQVVVPSVSWAAVLHGFAGTIFVVTPSSAGLDKPVAEVGACAATP
jgi:hypothetical protein